VKQSCLFRILDFLDVIFLLVDRYLSLDKFNW
jgi:hypothetical protein